MVSCTSLLGMSPFGINARGWWDWGKVDRLAEGFSDLCFAWLVVACGLAGNVNGVQGTV